nr:1454_t:CDS:10 [Entrophospora candida]
MYTNNNSNSGGRPYRKEDGSRDKQKIELAEFSIEDFRPEVFIQKALSNASEKGVRGFLDTLRESRELAAGDLQKNVYKNYNEFLESDMFVLRGLLNELRNISDNLRDDSTESVNLGPVAPVASEPIVSRGRQPTRNNATDIQSIWKAQIQLLWDHVEGAQKLVPLVPGRHIVREFSNFVEINASTNKPKQAVHMFLLNDCLLIAVKKKRQAAKETSSRVKLVADRCWSLEDIGVVDVRDGNGLFNIFKIMRHPTDQFVFQADKPEEKKNILNMAKRATDEMLSTKAEKHAVNAQNQQQQLTPLRRTLSRKNKSPMPVRSQQSHGPIVPKELTVNDVRELEELGDQLDVYIATREFEEAVENIDNAKDIKLDPIRAKMEDRIVKLSLAISHDLTNSDVKKSQVQKCVRWLLRLGYGEQAREMFLGARSKNIRIRTKQLKFEGDIPQYINELSLVYFTLIKNTCDWYNAAFRDMRMASGLVKWVNEEFEHYASMFKRQVYSLHYYNDNIVQECLRYAKEHCLMLRTVGFDLKFLLESLLKPDPDEIDDRASDTISQMTKDVATFLNWAALDGKLLVVDVEPEHDICKKMRLKAIAILSIMLALSVWLKR